jgi:glucose/arabinose dehydrogenase
MPFLHSTLILITTTLVLTSFIQTGNYFAYAAYTKAPPSAGGPTIKDPNLKTEIVFTGLQAPTSMAFLGPNDILVLGKNTGTVQRIVNGQILPQPLLHVNVGQGVEWGMLGIAVAKHNNNNENENGPEITYVFLYYTEPEANNSREQGGGVTEERGQVSGANNNNNTEPMVNHLYRYELVDNQLINPKLLLILPATSPVPTHENNHVGGKVVIGPDSNVYVGIGDVGGHDGQAQNVKDGAPLDGTSGILRVTQDGDAVVPNSPLGNDTDPTLNKYYAYGIRNSFGMDFDPVTGKLWDTENGAFCCDEINLVEPGFNSGWQQVQGIWQVRGPLLGPIFQSPPNNLVDFGGNGKYRSPEFTWLQTDGPTALKFLNSDKLGKQYENSMFVGDVNTGNLFNFKLDQERTGLDLSGPLSDKVANTQDELQDNIFGSGFGVITDIQVGPDDGYLYVLTYSGTIYRIVPSS